MFGRFKISKSAERRVHQRFVIPDGVILINGAEHRISDISMSGFRINPYRGDLKRGDDFTFSFVLPGDDGGTTYHGTGVVVRTDARGMAATYTMTDGRPELPFADFFHSLTMGL